MSKEASGTVSRVLLICPRTSQPRYHKRELALRALRPTSVAAFERAFYESNVFASGVALESLGRIADGKYASRTIAFLKAIRRVRRSLTGTELMYAMSMDCYLLGRLAGTGPGIIEIGDLRTIDSRNMIVHALERWVVNDCVALVVTSQGFVSEYLRTKLPATNRVYVIENKLDHSLRQHGRERKRQSHGRITIGLIGLLRYRRPIEMLITAVQKNERLRLKCYGDGPERSLIEAHVGERIEYNGPFRSPDDLARIYESVDVNYVVYDSNSGNVRLAMPNKFYESVYFGVPILAASGTELGRQVCARDVGGVLDTGNYEAFVESLSAVTPEWIETCSANCIAIGENELFDDGPNVLAQLLSESGSG